MRSHTRTLVLLRLCTAINIITYECFQKCFVSCVCYSHTGHRTWVWRTPKVWLEFMVWWMECVLTLWSSALTLWKTWWCEPTHLRKALCYYRNRFLHHSSIRLYLQWRLYCLNISHIMALSPKGWANIERFYMIKDSRMLSTMTIKVYEKH